MRSHQPYWMLAIIFANEPITSDSASLHVLAELRSLGVPIAFGRPQDSTFGLPPACVWYVTDRDDDTTRAAHAAGFQTVLIDATRAAASSPDDRAHTVAGVTDVLELIREPYTRSVLNLRYIMRTVLAFD